MKYFTKILFFCFLGFLLQGWLFPVFAADEAGGISKEIQEILVSFINFLSWGWVVPATIAGKLMTNEFVYGNVIHLSNFMWRVWTIMRQLANYAVGVLFLYNIFKFIFGAGDVSKLKEILFSCITSVILINISWFAIATMVDLSVVGIAAVGSMPSQVLKTQWNSLKQKYYIPSEYVINRNAIKKQGFNLGDVVQTGASKEISLNDILPQADNVTGPLFFLGVSVFNMLNMPYIDPKTTTWMSLSLETMLKLFIIALFTIPLLILCVTNMMRIFYLWVWIMLSPFVALDRAFNLGFGKKAGDQGKVFFEPAELISLIFQPVVTVAALGLCLILIIGIDQVIRGGSVEALSDIQKILCLTVDSAKDSTIGCEDVSFTKIVGGGFGGLTLHILLAFLASFLLWMIVKVSFAFSSIVKSTADGLYDFAEGALGAIPIPGTGGIGVNAAMNFADKYKDARQRKLEKSFGRGSNDAAERIVDKISQLTGIPVPPRNFTSDQVSKLRYAYKDGEKIKDATKFLSILQTIVKDSPKEFSQIKQVLTPWLSSQVTKDWLNKSSQSGLGITDAMIKDGTVYNHPQFQGFMDSLLNGDNIALAVTNGINTKKTIKDFTSKVYGKS